MERLLRLGLLAVVLVGIVFVAPAAAAPSPCAHGTSSVGPAVLIHGRLAKRQSDLAPQVEGCLPH